MIFERTLMYSSYTPYSKHLLQDCYKQKSRRTAAQRPNPKHGRFRSSRPSFSKLACAGFENLDSQRKAEELRLFVYGKFLSLTQQTAALTFLWAPELVGFAIATLLLSSCKRREVEWCVQDVRAAGMSSWKSSG